MRLILSGQINVMTVPMTTKSDAQVGVVAERAAKKVWSIGAQYIAIPIAAFSLGFGTSEFTVAQSLRERVTDLKQNVMINNEKLVDVEHNLDIEVKERRDEDASSRSQLESERKRTDERIFSLVNLVEKVMEQNREVVGLFKLQNQIQQSKQP